MLPYVIVYFLCHYKYMGWIWFWSIGMPWYFFSLFIDFKWGRLVPLRNQTKPLFVPGQPYYTALVEVDREELQNNKEIQLYPGMAATVMIGTKARTALDYLLGPIAAAFDQSFRQK